MNDSKTDKPRHSKRVIECIDGIMARKDGSMTDSKTANERMHTWSYLCDTCKLSGYDVGIFGPPGTEWECWADWGDGGKPFMKMAVNGEQDPLEVCPHYKRKEQADG